MATHIAPAHHVVRTPHLEKRLGVVYVGANFLTVSLMGFDTKATLVVHVDSMANLVLPCNNSFNVVLGDSVTREE